VTRRPRRSVTAVVGVVVPSVDRSMPGPVGASALDSQARESPALVLGGRLGRGPRGHGLVVHQLDTRGRRDVPHVRVSDSTEPVDIRRRNGPRRGRDGQDSEMSTRSQLAGRKLFGNPTPQSVPSPARRRIGPQKRNRFARALVVPIGTRGAKRGHRRPSTTTARSPVGGAATEHDTLPTVPQSPKAMNAWLCLQRSECL